MPLLAVNVSDKLLFDIKEHVEKGKYQSPESFLEIAAFNQLALERGATPAELIGKGHRKIRSDDSSHSDDVAISETGRGTARAASRRQSAPVAKKATDDDDALLPEEIEAATKRLA